MIVTMVGVGHLVGIMLSKLSQDDHMLQHTPHGPTQDPDRCII